PNGEIMVLFSYKIMILNADGSFNRDVLSGPVTINRKLFSPFRFDVQPDGKIVSLGSVRWGSTDQIAVARFNPDGEVDTSFAARGLYLRQTNQPAALDRILIQPDGKILGVSGVFTVTDIALMRLLGSSSPAPSTGKPLDR
ncbi:MAG TPA: delta-60 repeat domain-containing protein, partial [Pyrinomonadaceae bacterium]